MLKMFEEKLPGKSRGCTKVLKMPVKERQKFCKRDCCGSEGGLNLGEPRLTKASVGELRSLEKEKSGLAEGEVEQRRPHRTDRKRECPELGGEGGDTDHKRSRDVVDVRNPSVKNFLVSCNTEEN